MIWLKEYFSIYINLVMLAIGFYMAFVQSINLLKDQHFLREGQFCKIVGYTYIAVGVFGVAIMMAKI